MLKSNKIALSSQEHKKRRFCKVRKLRMRGLLVPATYFCVSAVSIISRLLYIYIRLADCTIFIRM